MPLENHIEIAYRCAAQLQGHPLETLTGQAQLAAQGEVGQAELAPIRPEIERYAEEVVPALERGLEATGAPPIEKR